MAGGGAIPRHLRASLLGNREFLLRETRSTPLYYFPGPLVALVVVLGLDLSTRWSALGLTSFYGGLPYVAGRSGADLILDLYLLLTLIVLLLLFVRYLQWIRTVYAVTSTRIIIQKGILARDFVEIPVSQVRGIDVHQTVFERMLGFGSLQISSEGGRTVGNEVWRGIPRPFQFQRDVENASANLLQPAAPASAAPGAGAPRFPGAF